jgi:hypothetical protein
MSARLVNPRIHSAVMPALLLLAACGQPAPHSPASSQARQPGQPSPAGIASPLHSPATADATPAGIARNTAGTSGATEATSTVHAYLQALSAGQVAHADAMWANGMPGSRRDDAVLRDGRAFDALRIATDAPVALDRETPPRAYEIPVHLRFSRESRMQRINGGYRLRLAIDGRHWEITGASLQPAID